MNFKTYRKIEKNEQVYVLEITMGDYMRAKFDDFDRKLLKDCGGEDATIADKLLALEMVARRIEEGGIEKMSKRRHSI